jgi:predicted ATPase
MMQKLIVRNFGPIRELDLDIKDLSLFIGEQATGKSTVAKLIYFFKSLRDDLMAYLYESEIQTLEVLRQDFLKNIKSKFSPRFFGSTKHLPAFHLKFKYKSGTYLQIRMNDRNYVNATFTDTESGTSSVQSFGELDRICWQINDFRTQFLRRDAAFLSGPDYRQFEFDKRSKRLEIEYQINQFFGDDRDTLLIPAGRSLLAILSEQLQTLETYSLDFLMRAFLVRIDRLKPAFSLSLNEIVRERNLNGNHIPDNERIEAAIQKIREVLKGEYRVDRFGEKIYIDAENYVKLSMASSGQQESVWILLQLFILLLNREKVFLVIEEPEAHLFPKAQKSIVELITLVFKENDSQVLITTHSPYILTAFNNLIYAGNVGQQHQEVSEIVPEMLWIDHEKVGAYRLSGGSKVDIMDEETHLIRAEELDTVSQSINQEFDAILNLELQ